MDSTKRKRSEGEEEVEKKNKESDASKVGFFVSHSIAKRTKKRRGRRKERTWSKDAKSQIAGNGGQDAKVERTSDRKEEEEKKKRNSWL